MSLEIIFDIMEKVREEKECICCNYLHSENDLKWHLNIHGDEGLHCKSCIAKDY